MAESSQIMGIVNVTQDSFFDGGKFWCSDQAIKHINQLLKEEVDVLDIGAESSRPGAKEISAQDELSKVKEVLDRLPSDLHTEISVDSSRSIVAEYALNHGASMINDIYALRRDPELGSLLGDKKCKVVLMHMQGTPQNMQKNPVYGNVVDDICYFFEERVQYATKQGISPDNIILDPGIGFGKKLEHNIKILCQIESFKKLGFPLLVGPSRKRFIGELTGHNVSDRLFGTLGIVSFLILHKIKYIRVHDVGAAVDIKKVLSPIGV